MTTETKSRTIQGKPIKVCASESFNNMYGGMEAGYYTQLALALLNRHPVDMLVFEKVYLKNKNGTYKMNADKEPQIYMQIRSAGYSLIEDQFEPDETTILNRGQSLDFKKFWFKVDDFETHYIGTFIFPEDY